MPLATPLRMKILLDKYFLTRYMEMDNKLKITNDKKELQLKCIKALERALFLCFYI